MINKREKMSTQYAAVFVFSILMFLFLLTVGSLISPKGSPLGIVFWGYASWLIYKQKIQELVNLFRVMVWFVIITIAIVLGAFILAKEDAGIYFVDSLADALVVLLIALAVNYGLLTFFKRQMTGIKSQVIKKINSNSHVEDRHWEMASVELDSSRNEATWAKAFSLSDGDEARAKALYLKLRAEAMSDIELENKAQTEISNQSTVVSNTNFWNSNDRFLAIIFFIAVTVGIIFLSFKKDPMQLSSARDTNKPEASVSIERGRNWQSDVAGLQRGIRSGSIRVYKMNVNQIDNPFYLPKHILSNFDALSPEGVKLIEAQNIWWIEDDIFYIRIYNPSAKRIVGFNFLMQKGKCNQSNLKIDLGLGFDLNAHPVPPSSHQVYTSTLPVKYSSIFERGENCGIVTAVLVEK